MNTNHLINLKEVRILINKIREHRNIKPFQEYFRGQVSETFTLIPSLSRKFSNYDALEKVEKLLLEDFKKEMIENNKINMLSVRENQLHFQNDWSWLVQAQHYRLPTRLLDWTLCWEVALYFAVEEQFEYNSYLNSHDGQFWLFYVPDELIMSEENQIYYYQKDPFKFNHTGFLNPDLFWTKNHENETAERRRARQHGKFSIQGTLSSLTPLEQQRKFIPYLKKYLIPSAAKKQIRLDLASEGITGEFLYVGEDNTINCIIASLKNKYGLMDS